MSNELYFIPIIAEALRQPNPRMALDIAFQRIESLGRATTHHIGYRQFLRFMACSFKHWEETPIMATDESSPPLIDETYPVEIWLERGNQRLPGLVVDQIPCRKSFAELTPDRYRLVTDTGWLLWEATLTPRELFWTLAHPHRNLPLAAQTDDEPILPTLETHLLGGALTIRVYSGLESGILDITFESGRASP
jgi:hypothetical protein